MRTARVAIKVAKRREDGFSSSSSDNVTVWLNRDIAALTPELAGRPSFKHQPVALAAKPASDARCGGLCIALKSALPNDRHSPSHCFELSNGYPIALQRAGKLCLPELHI